MEAERKRGLSGSEEGEAAKVPRLEARGSDSSSSDSGSDSDSSISSGEETQEQSKISPTTNPLNLSNSTCSTSSSQELQPRTDESFKDNSQDAPLPGQDSLLARRLEEERARKRQGSGLSMEGEGEFSLGSIDALKQFLAVSAEGAGCGPTDPVFVDHEDSQHATTMDSPASCPYSAPPFARENVSPDSTTDGAAPAPAPAEGAEVTNVFPRAQIDTIEETMKKSELTPEEITSYCKKIFVFKELEVAKFKTWKERRAYYKQSQKKKIDNLLSNRPTLPEGTKIITIPSLEMSTIPGTEGDSAINQKVVKKSKKKWLMNPVGKSMVCLLHEYVQQSLKMQPYYTFTELDNAATPYAAIVHINKIEYGRGTGSSKKIAKSEAAKRTLEMLIPDIKDKLPAMGGAEEAGEGPDLSFFDDIRVEDPRVAELCNRTSEPAPYQILVTCLQRNYGLGDTHIHQELKAVRNGKNEYTMRVDKREVDVICKNKKDGKQLAAAKLLQQLHPHISSWGSLLRMYGNRSIRTLKKKKEKETEVTGLQSRSSQSSVAPSMAILEKLKEEMRNLRDIKKAIAPIGKFVMPSGSSATGIHTDHVDF